MWDHVQPWPMGDDEHAQVPTYVPASQREIWREEAASMDMSQAEYVRTMVQAGRRSFDLAGDPGAAGSDDPDEPTPGGATPGVETLKERILDTIEREGAADWDEILSEATENVEARLDEALDDLQSQDRIQHSGKEGGYVVVDDGR